MIEKETFIIASQDDKEPRIMPKALVPFFRKWINVARFKTKSLRINHFYNLVDFPL
mgnify:CR=1 FL=1